MKKSQSRSAALLGDVVDSVFTERPLSLTHVGPESAQGYIMTELANRLPEESVVFAIAKDQKDALLWGAITELFGIVPSIFLTAEEVFAALTDRTALHRVTVIPAETLMQPIPSDKRKVVRELSVGMMGNPGEFSAWLAEHGYRFEKAADIPKSFARRGGIVDCYVPGRAEAIRVEFTDNTVTSITTYSPHKKIKPKTLTTVIITAAELPPDGADLLLSYIPKERNVLVFRDSEEFVHTLPGWSKVENRMTEYPRIHFESLSTAPHARSLGAKALPILPKHWDQIAEFIREHHATRIIALTANEKRLQGFLKEYKLTSALQSIVVQPHAKEFQGFLSTALKMIVLCDRDLFGIEQAPEEAPQSEHASFDKLWVGSLKEGSFVVHFDHGIGRFTGTTVQRVGDVEREYFVLEYAEGDKLFVPVELADKLSKYIGVPNPSMTRLSGGNWKEITEKVKKDTLAIAKELLVVAAERERAKAPILKGEGDEKEAKLSESFPYKETPDQARAIREVLHDLELEKPMDRLICGDVGFGKTEVAIRAAFKAAANGYQVAVLSPTTILAQQHFDTFTERLEAFDVKVDLLSRFRSAKAQTRVLAGVRSGDIDIVIGTHRLLSDDVHFKKIGLLIIDEEQRFGVQAKEYLKRLRKEVHVLSLSATPIPRTLHLSLSGIRDLSIIKTAPEGRKPITTHIAPYGDDQVKRIIEKELERGGQAYYVFNKVETIIPKMKELKKLVPSARFGIAHGQLAEIDLARVMSSFDKGDIDVLIASTIIENGLDLPNVNTMIVEDAPNFGLAQLYQLRGRIGRGDREAYAYFFYHEQKIAPDARKRLSALLEAERLGSGIELAMRDMEIRGIGNILGKAQHGRAQAIGLALYSRLLKQAIQEMRGQTLAPLSDVDIDLPISIGIPKNIIYEETDRLRLYQELANEEAVDSLRKKAQREFREPFAEPIANLVYALELKIVARAAQIKSITTESPVSGKRVVVIPREQFGPEEMGVFIKRKEVWDVTNERTKIPLADLGDNWKKQLLVIMNQLAEVYAVKQKAAKRAGKEKTD